MLRALAIGLAMLGSGGPGPIASEPEVTRARADAGAGMLRYETEHFVVLSDAPASWARSRAALLERTRDQFLRFTRRCEIPTADPDHKLIAIIFDRHEDYAAFASRDAGMAQSWMAGYYSPSTNRIAFYNDSDSPSMRRAEDAVASLARDLDAKIEAAMATAERARAAGDTAAAADIERRCAEARASLEAQARTLRRDAAAFATAKTIHEAIHLLSFNTGVQSPTSPQAFWFSEGLAGAFETSEPASAFGPDRADPAWDRELDETRRATGLIPLRELVEFVEPPRDEARIRAAYAQSRALVRWLHRFDRDALGAFSRALRDEPAGSITPARLGDLFESAVGDIDEIERRLRWRTAGS